MTQIHAALSHYWHLRDQGIDPDAAVEHVKLRFGVKIDREQMLPEAATPEFPQPKFEIGQKIDGGPIHGGPVTIMDIRWMTGAERFDYKLRWPTEGRFSSWCWDVEEWTTNPAYKLKPVRVVEEPLRKRFAQKTYCTGNPQGLMGTA